MAIVGKRKVMRLEFALIVIIAAALVLVLLSRLQAYAELAERGAVEATLGHMQTALQVRFTLEAASKGGAAATAARWRGADPVTLSRVTPANFDGERVGLDLRDLPAGSWVFDLDRRQLVYVPRFARSLGVPGSRDPVPALRFDLQVDGPPRHSGWVARVVPVLPYAWGDILRRN